MDHATAIAGRDFTQVSWDDGRVAFEDVARSYVVEHVIPAKCDLKRSAYCLGLAMSVWGPRHDARKLTRADGRLYAQVREKDGVKSATIRREMAIIGAALRHAVKEERLVKAPKFAMPAQSSPRIRWLTPEEWARLRCTPKPARIQRFLLIAFGTGVRSRAIEELQWSRVDFANRTMDFRVPGVVYKNKRRPIAPINDELLPRLQAMYDRRNPADPYVIGLGPRGKPSCTYAGVKEALAAIGIREAGVARHVARHSFCSWRVQKGFSYAHIGALVGDTAGMIERVYGHLSPHHLMAASNLDTSILRAA